MEPYVLQGLLWVPQTYTYRDTCERVTLLGRGLEGFLKEVNLESLALEPRKTRSRKDEHIEKGLFSFPVPIPHPAVPPPPGPKGPSGAPQSHQPQP